MAPVLWRSEFRKEYEVASRDVLSLVRQSECSAYDCGFVALAKGLGIRLVTLDRRLPACFPDTATFLTDRKL